MYVALYISVDVSNTHFGMHKIHVNYVNAILKVRTLWQKNLKLNNTIKYYSKIKIITFVLAVLVVP